MSGGPETLNAVQAQVTSAEHRFNLELDHVVRIRLMEQQIARYGGFRLPPIGHTYFRDLGISTNSEAAGSHSHPVSKTLEDYMLRVVLPALLDVMNKPFCSWFLKERKHDRLLNDLGVPANQRQDYPLLNFRLTEPDGGRYRIMHELPPPAVEQEVLFMQDTLHHLTPADIVKIFCISPELNYIVGSIEYPVPLLLGAKWFECAAYSYRLTGDGNFEHAPDRIWSESYTQPLSGKWLLEAASLHGNGIDLGVHVQWVRVIA